MGLDTTAVEIVTHLPGYRPPIVDGWPDLPEDVFEVWCYASFPRALDGMEGATKVKRLGGEDALGGEFYAASGRYDGTHSSYGGHHAFRAELAVTVTGLTFEALIETPEQWIKKGVPFMDLINFADNEGTLGSQACARLAQDFASRASLRRRLSLRSQQLWDDWRRCTDLAANTGIIDFH